MALLEQSNPQTSQKVSKRSRGSQALARLGIPQFQIAKAADVVQSAVSDWMSGEKRPTSRPRRNILAAYGIPPEWWDEPLSNAIVNDAQALRATLPRAPVSVQEDEPDNHTIVAAALMPGADKVSAFEQIVDRCIRDIRATSSADVPTRKVLELGRMLVNVRKLRGDDVREVDVFKHPKWLALQSIILGALARHPDALQAVREAIAAVQGSG